MLNPSKIVKYMALSFLFLIMTVVVFYGVQWFSDSMENLLINKSVASPASFQLAVSNASEGVVSKLPNQDTLPYRDWQVENVKLDARAAISLEVGKNSPKVLFTKNDEVRLPVASLTKLMTVLVALENYDVSKTIKISQSAMDQVGDQGDLKLDQEFTVRSLLYSILMESNNRAAYALAETLGIEKFLSLMNQDAKNLHLASTRFVDVTGLDADSYSTAKDMALLAQYLFKNYPLFGEIIKQKEYNLYLADGTFHHKMVNTNSLLGQYGVIGGKTGYTNEAQGCFMVVSESSETGNYIINIVLGAQDRFSEMQKLINWLQVAYLW